MIYFYELENVTREDKQACDEWIEKIKKALNGRISFYEQDFLTNGFYAGIQAERKKAEVVK